MKILTACFMGGAMGSLVALHFGVVWWVGVIAGGIIGWMTYEPMKIICTVKTVAREIDYRGAFDSIGQICLPSLIIVAIIAGTCLSALVATICLMFLFTSLGASLLAFINARDLVSFASEYYARYPDLLYVQDKIVVGTYVTTLCGLTALLASKVFRDESYLGFGACCILLSPSIAPIVIVVVLTWCACRALSYIPRIVRFTGGFIKKVFLMVHSEIRLLCMTDSLIGALIGYFNGNPIIGGITGAILGVLNFELVSKRLLKLVLK